jgi:hypothetical protein
MQLKQLYAGGFLTAEEFNARRIALVNQMTGTSGAPAAAAAPVAAVPGYAAPSPYGAAPAAYASPPAAYSVATPPAYASPPTAAYSSPLRPVSSLAPGGYPPPSPYSLPPSQPAALPANVIVNHSSPAAVRNPYAPQAPKGFLVLSFPFVFVLYLTARCAAAAAQVSVVERQERQEPKRKEIPRTAQKVLASFLLLSFFISRFSAKQFSCSPSTLSLFRSTSTGSSSMLLAPTTSLVSRSSWTQV